MASKPLQTSDLIFPTLSTDFSTTLSSLKRSTLSMSNRLRSITFDAEFVCSVADAYERPLVANERCGSWYIPLERKAASAYFKSTDGHMGEWSFSLRRLNTQVLAVVGENDGCVIVDSTRRGKRMPDALSKTVPVWCAVWNRLLFPEDTQSHQLHTPPQSVSESEHSQIEAHLSSFIKQAHDLNLNLSSLRTHLTKPLRPLWITQDSILPSSPPSFPLFHPVILCTSSRRVSGGEASEGGYIQGAGDDSETWARGLTAQLFWENKSRVLESQETDLPGVIEELLAQSRSKGSRADSILIKPTNWVSVCPSDSLQGDAVHAYDAVIACAEAPHTAFRQKNRSRYLHLKCTAGKLGSRDLRRELPKLEAFMRNLPTIRKLLICCQNGKDVSVGVALAVLCLYVDDSGQRSAANENISKVFIRRRLSWIMTSFPAASPSRATLQSVNAFLFSPRETEPPGSICAERPRSTEPISPAPADAVSDPPPPSISTAAASATANQTPLHATFTCLSTEPEPEPPWTLSRTLTSALPGMPSGTFTGTATFTPRAPTAPGYAAEHLYAENGTLRTANGLEFQAQRKYVWRYRGPEEASPTPDAGREEQKEANREGGVDEGISVWFAGGDGESADGLFVEMEFESENEGDEGDGWDGEGRRRKLRASGRHFCEPDDYRARFCFGEDGGLVVEYVVKGPRKDYVSVTRYRRQG